MIKEEAIKILKDFHDKSALFSVRTALETLHPELKESEDERIRKEIIAWLKNSEGQTLPIDRYNAALAWLEKQGEKKLTVEMKTPEESLDIDSDTYNKIVDECIYGENKPADKVEPKFKVKYAGSEYNVLEIKEIAGDTYYGIEDEPNHIDYVLPDYCEIVSEQKSAWSEDDEKMLVDAYVMLDWYKGNNWWTARRIKDWLNSLKERIGE